MLTEGIHDNVPMADYLADPAPGPSLSTGAVMTLNERSPLHAMREHPRLGRRPSDASTRGDLGSAVHALLFGGAKVEFVGEVTRRSGKEKGERFLAEDWKTQDARDARDEIRARGNVPMLTKDAPLLDAIEGSIRGTLAAADIDLARGRCEATLVWQEAGGVWCRGRSDWLSADFDIDLDLKTTENADPSTWIRSTMIKSGYHVQLGLRRRGLNKILGERSRLSLCLVAEISPPFACSLVAVGPSLEELADRQISRAVSIWGRCLRTGNWPGYHSAIHYAEAPAWAEYDFEERNIAP